MELKNYFAQDSQGNAQPNAVCYLYEVGTETLVTGLVNGVGVSLSNPFYSDSYGLIQFKAPNGVYELRVVSNVRDYRIRIQCVDVDETVAEAESHAEAASLAAQQSADARDAAETYAENALGTINQVVDARDAAEAAVVDALGSLTQSQAAALAAQQTAYNLSTQMTAFRSVRNNGAVGDGVVNDYASIQAALDQGGEWYFPPGIYRNTSQTWRLYSNTKLVFAPGARVVNDITDPAWQSGCLFANGPIGGALSVGGYDATSDITIVGGLFDGGPRTARGDMTSFFNIAHAKRLRFLGSQFDKHSGNTHAIEINSSQDVLFDTCEFTGYEKLTATLGTREYLNIDQSSETGFPAFGPWDNTPCDDITVRRCIFKGGDVAVGSHNSTPVNPHTRIRVLDCTISDMTSRGINFYYWKNSIVRGNTVRNTVVGIRGLYSVNCIIEGNTIDEMTSLAMSIGGGLPGIVSSGIIVKGNIMGVCGGIVVNATHAAQVVDNTFTDLSGITSSCIGGLADVPGSCFRGNIAKGDLGTRLFYNTLTGEVGSVIEIDGKFFLYILNDSVGYVADTRRPMGQGVTLVSTNSSLVTAGPCGLFWTRTSPGAPVCRSLVQYNTSPVEVAVTPLTGTTGPAGTTTVNALDNKIGIENRSGSNRTYEVSFL